MVEAEKVSVRIVRYSDDIPYTEYAPPTTSTEHGGSPNERYIEVSTNERYQIEMKLLRGFKFLGQPKVRVKYILDNTSYFGILSRSRPSGSSSTDLSHREDGCLSVNRIINGQKMECGLTFGELESDEDVGLGDKEIAQAVDEAGRIVVKVWRGRFGGKLRDSSEPRAFDPLDHVDDTKSCKEVVYKHNVSHVTTHVPLRPFIEPPSRPGSYEREWIRADGPAGKAVVFTFRYRSRGALIALGVIDDVQHEPSQSEIDESADMDLTSIYRTATSTSPELIPNIFAGLFAESHASRSGDTHDSDEYSDDEGLDENNGSDATLVADGEETDSDSNPRNGKDAILVSDGEEDDEEGDSGSIPHNRNDPMLVTDGEESNSDGDLQNGPDESVAPRQETPTRNEEEIRPSQSTARPVEPRQETPTQNGEETHTSRSNEEPMYQKRHEAEAHTEIRQRVTEYMEREAEPDQAKAITAVKRKTKDEQTEDFPSSKRYLMTLAEATDV